MKQVEPTNKSPEDLSRYLEKVPEINEKLMTALLDQARAAQTYWLGLCRSIVNFMTPSLDALISVAEVKKEMLQSPDKLEFLPPQETLKNVLDAWDFNFRIGETGFINGLAAMNDFHTFYMTETFKAWLNTALGLEGEDIAHFMARQAKLMDLLVHKYPEAIRAIAPEYGFHFDDGGYLLVDETDRFYLYQVLPRHPKVKVREQGKPVIIIPPYVLGANIMAFLPGEDKSFVHCFANQGIPTYIRIVKEIYANEAVQVITGEEDCLDTRRFCEKIQDRNGKPVTLCGYCQGGYTAVINLLSGELDGLVDALITCVAPMDGTRSKGLATFVSQIPERLKDVRFAIKTLPNGNQVVQGRLLSWVFKLKNMAKENPITAFFRDLKMLETGLKIGKSAAAINYWLLYDVTDLPVDICKISYSSYTIPVADDGTLPVQLFGRPLNFKRLKEKGIHWLICCSEQDDLVEQEVALAPLDWVDAEVTVFPKGHVAIATSWSLPLSECSLHKCFLNFRGPVRYQLDLDAAFESPAPPVAEAKPSKPAAPPAKPTAKPSKPAKPAAPAPKLAKPPAGPAKKK